MMEQLHFLRPLWLLALLPLIIFSWLLLRRALYSRSWQKVVDPKLLPHVLIGETRTRSRRPVLLFFICGLLGIVALAGPAWEKLPQPVYKARSALVIALDLSRSMDAGDIKPSRLTRAHYKINDILKLRKEGDTALIAYAADAFTVIPLTDDGETIANLVSSLTTDIMPAQGSRADRALQKAAELLRNAAIQKGHVLLITDGIEAAQLEAFSDLASAGHHVSILALGTDAGSPIPLAGGGFLQDTGGNIVIARTDAALMRMASSNGNGRFSRLSNDDADIKHILSFVASDMRNDADEQSDLAADLWREQGPWLLLLAAPLAALAFRRGFLLLWVLIILPLPQPAQALSWDALWKNADQRGAEKLQREQPAQAAELFTDPQWKAAAHYRAQQYEKSLAELDGVNSADAHYNRGNALARLGRYEDAIAAYDQALAMSPDMEDAAFNKQQIEQRLQQPPQETQNKPDQDPNGQAASSDNKQDSDSASAGQQQAGDESASETDAGQATQQPDSSEQAQHKATEQEERSAQQAEALEQNPAQTGEQQTASEEIQSMSQQAREQWLKTIPDDPGGLLRRKFLYQYRNTHNQQQEDNPW